MSVKIVKFGNIPDAIKEGNELAILELVTRVTASAKSLAPVDTGNLKGSVMGRVSGGDINHQEGPAISARAKEGSGYVGTAVLYGIYNEFGTRKMAAQPFLRPAVAEATGAGRASRLVKKFQVDSVRKGMARGPRKTRVYK